jgi:hypothetical protein
VQLTAVQFASAMNELKTDILQQARNLAAQEATRIADARPPAGWWDAAWRIFCVVPRFFSSGLFFIVLGGLLLKIAYETIDNTTVCVPLDHLWDPNIGTLEKDNDYSVRGRANLLSVVSVVAPWAYFENFQNIQTMKNNIWNKIDRSDLNLKQTVDILSNIQLRLDSQGPNTNKNVYLPNNLKADCIKYGRRWATADQLKY